MINHWFRRAASECIFFKCSVITFLIDFLLNLKFPYFFYKLSMEIHFVDGIYKYVFVVYVYPCTCVEYTFRFYLQINNFICIFLNVLRRRWVICTRPCLLSLGSLQVPFQINISIVSFTLIYIHFELVLYSFNPLLIFNTHLMACWGSYFRNCHCGHTDFKLCDFVRLTFLQLHTRTLL